MAAETIDDNALVSLERFQEYLTLSTADGHDDLLTMIINRCSAGARKYLEFDPLSQNYTEKYDGMGDDTLVLDNLPIISVGALSDGTDSVGTEDEDYFVYKDEGIIRLEGGAFSNDRQNVFVDYDAGYAEIPKDIQDAITLWGQARFAARGTTASAGRQVQRETTGDRTVVYESEEVGGATVTAEDMPDEARAILDRYRRRHTRAV